VVNTIERADSSAGHTDRSRPESEQDKLDREHEQLFHELRSIIPGVEVQFAFLLTVAFSQRFESLTEVQRNVYYVTFVLSGISLVLLLAPSSFHRVRFRQHDKEVMMRWANVEVLVALFLTSLSIAGTVFLISDLLFTTWFALLAGSAVWAATSALWWLGPLMRRRA
jgi:hypothetical protein